MTFNIWEVYLFLLYIYIYFFIFALVHIYNMAHAHALPKSLSNRSVWGWSLIAYVDREMRRHWVSVTSGLINNIVVKRSDKNNYILMLVSLFNCFRCWNEIPLRVKKRRKTTIFKTNLIESTLFQIDKSTKGPLIGFENHDTSCSICF